MDAEAAQKKAEEDLFVQGDDGEPDELFEHPSGILGGSGGPSAAGASGPHVGSQSVVVAVEKVEGREVGLRRSQRKKVPTFRYIETHRRTR